MVFTITQIIIIIGLPFLITSVVNKNSILRFIGPILLAYIAGIILSSIPGSPWDKALSMSISEVTVLIAIPIVLMCTDLVKWFRLAKSTVISFALVMFSAMLAALFSAYIFRAPLKTHGKEC